MIHGAILSVLAGLALVAYLARRKPKATHVVICGDAFADDSPSSRRTYAQRLVDRELALPPKRKKRK
jgi:hypothetical protein